jgi:uncharacterized membrane protein YcaP (DUF421 family)
MFELDTPWWEVLTRAVVIYAALLILVRLSGRRTVGQFTPFDLLVVLLLSESVSNGLVGGDQSLLGGLMAAAMLIALNMLVALVTSRSFRAQELIEGRPALMGRDGEIFQEVLKRHRIPLRDVERSLREADCDLKDMKVMFLEADGHISILQHSTGEGASEGVRS